MKRQFILIAFVTTCLSLSWSLQPNQAAPLSGLGALPIDNFGATTLVDFRRNYSTYNLNTRDYQASVGADQGLFLTCDSGEIAVGAFCEEKLNAIGQPNALLTAGIATARSGACKWQNPGNYRIAVSCMAISALRGDTDRGVYHQNDLLK